MHTRLAIIFLSSALGGCYHILDSKVDMPETKTARPASPAAPNVPTGSIFADRGVHQPLFEDRKPRQVGDIVTINLNEKVTASQNTNSKAERTSTLNLPVPKLTGIAGLL